MSGIFNPPTSSSGLQSRTTATYTTASLADAARETGAVTMAKGFAILKIVTNVAARVRIYQAAAIRDSDAARSVLTEPPEGYIVDAVTAAGDLTRLMPPGLVSANMEASPSTSIAITVDNLSGSTQTVTVTITYLQLEA